MCVMERLACIPSKFHALHGAYDFPINFCSMGLTSILSHSSSPKAGKSSYAPPRSFITSEGRKSSGNLVPPSCGFSRGCVYLHTLTAQRKGTNSVDALKQHTGNSVKIIFSRPQGQQDRVTVVSTPSTWESQGRPVPCLAWAAGSQQEGRSSGSCRDGGMETFLSHLPARSTWGSHSPVAMAVWGRREEPKSSQPRRRKELSYV